MLRLAYLAADANPCFGRMSSTQDQSIFQPSPPLAMDAHLLAAASHLNLVLVVKQLITSGVCHDHPTFGRTSSSLLGRPLTLAAKAGCAEILSLLSGESFAPTDNSHWHQQRDILAQASAAGQVEAVRFLLKRRRNPACDNREIRRYLCRAMRTPSLEVYEMIRSAIDDLDAIPARERRLNPLGTKSFYTTMFKTCVWEGWISMAVYFLDFGAPIDSCRENGIEAAFIDTSPLAYACRTGNVAMVRILLDRGLDARYAMSYAAAGGNLELVRLLLDHGCDPNEGYPPPITWAVDLEHDAMFTLLHSRGAEMKLPSVRQDIVARARGAGLESMLSLILDKEDIDPYGPGYTTPLPRPRKLCLMCEPQTEWEEE